MCCQERKYTKCVVDFIALRLLDFWSILLRLQPTFLKNSNSSKYYWLWRNRSYWGITSWNCDMLFPVGSHLLDRSSLSRNWQVRLPSVHWRFIRSSDVRNTTVQYVEHIDYENFPRVLMVRKKIDLVAGNQRTRFVTLLMSKISYVT